MSCCCCSSIFSLFAASDSLLLWILSKIAFSSVLDDCRPYFSSFNFWISLLAILISFSYYFLVLSKLSFWFSNSINYVNRFYLSFSNYYLIWKSTSLMLNLPKTFHWLESVPFTILDLIDHYLLKELILVDNLTACSIPYILSIMLKANHVKQAINLFQFIYLKLACSTV